LVQVLGTVFDLSEDTVETRMFKALLDWLTENTAYHVVNWPGGFRFVIGLLFSGDYNTSILNTLHIVWAMHSYAASRQTEICRTSIRDGNFRMKVQGDDVIGYFSGKVAHEMSPQGLVEYLATWDLESKASAFRCSDTLLTPMTRMGMLGRDPRNCVVFLKRYLTLQDGVIRPFRPTTDFVYKLYLSTSDLPTPALYASKLIGLALDTHGVNSVAYRIIRKVFDTLVARQDEGFLLEVERMMMREEFLASRLYKSGMGACPPAQVLSLSLSRRAMLDKLDGKIEDPQADFLWKTGSARPVPLSKY
jgi:hypothetical protein